MASNRGYSGDPRDGDPDEQDSLTDSSSGDSSSEEDELPLRPGEERRLRRILAEQETLRQQLTARLAEAELDHQFQKLRSLVPGADNNRRPERRGTLAEARGLIRALEDMAHATGVPVDNNTKVGVPAFKKPAPVVPLGVFQLILPQGIPVELQYPQFPSTEGVTHANPVVEVFRDPEGKVKVKITCLNRKGLLADLFRTIGSKKLTPKDGTYLRREPYMLLDVELEKGHPSMEPIAEASTSEPRPHPPPQPLPVETEENDLLRELLLGVIRRDPADPDKKGDSNGKGGV